MKNIITHVYRRLAGLRRDAEGFVVMSTLAIFLFIFVLCAFVYAVGETIHQRVKMQNACDAAAYSAAVVQADGLSRMAAVNRAMSWSYVQMTNRQMDYITYRWLKLTCKRFWEDLENAEEYNSNIVLAVDKELGWWALLEGVISGGISKIFKLDCTGKKGNKVESVWHGKEGHGWWCGIDVGERKDHLIRFNQMKDEKFWNDLKAKGLKEVTNQFTSYENMNKILSLLSFIDKGDSPSGWGEYLGKWIDYDKRNIDNLNKALEHINAQMNISMKMVAESTLKSMLQDPRLSESEALKDYYISIHIPSASNPYDEDKTRSAAPESYFSPLHNTEADEMLFLNMTTPESAQNTLPQHFPRLADSNVTLPRGLDQWFIRGKGLYSDGEDHSCDGVPMNNVSFAESAEFHRATMIRDEGMAGIQRVYKDANLNENKAGFMATERKKKVGEHPDRYVRSNGGKGYAMLPDCCKQAIDMKSSIGFGQGNKKNYYHVLAHPVYANVPDEKKAVWRGNHLIDFMGITSSVANAISDYMTKGSQGDGDKGEDEGVTNQSELEKKLEEIRDEALQNGEDVSEIPEFPGGQNGSVEPVQDLNNDESKSAMKSGMSKLTNALSGLLGNIMGSFLDVHPSCENDPKLDYSEYPMCKTISKPTSALYSEYRWASGKWFCMTKLFTYTVCSLFDEENHHNIYCDWAKAKIKASFMRVGFKVTVDGYMHLGWPKWFCGYSPSREFLDPLGILPPLISPIPISGGKHGYMDHPLLDLLNLKNGGFVRPIKVLWADDEEDRTFSREEYESCAMFPDGVTVPIAGHYSWPAPIQGHARIYGDDKEIFNNRYVGARCKPWVLNERFFAGEGTIVVGAAMKHTNPLVQLFNLWNTRTKEKKTASGTETQKDAERTVLSAFNIPEGNYMWTMSAARAGVRHVRRNGQYDQERQYQITYDSISDVENLNYQSIPYVFLQDDSGTSDKGHWITVDAWGDAHDDNPNALSRIDKPAQKEQKEVPIWNGCPCTGNEKQFHDMWNLCETDWDATLIPLRYAAQKAGLYLNKGSGGKDVEGLALNEQDYRERLNLIRVNYQHMDFSASGLAKNDNVFGNGTNWMWNPLDPESIVLSPFIMNGWKRADASFFENLINDNIPGAISTGLATGMGDLNLNTKVPTGKEEKTVNVFLLLKDKVL